MDDVKTKKRTSPSGTVRLRSNVRCDKTGPKSLTQPEFLNDFKILLAVASLQIFQKAGTL